MNYNFDSIAGYEVEKEELKRLCEIFNNREKYEKKGAKLPKGIVFYGEAGTGKTLFSKVLAGVCGLEVFKIDLGDVENESAICRHIKKTFVKASKRKKPTMIFFDEVDKILPNDGERYYTDRSKTILTQLLTLIDGMDSSGNIVFVATCNYYDNLPETLTRPGRLDKKIGIGAPNFSSRVAILKMYAQKSSCRFELPIEDIAKFTVGYTGAALETLVNECILQSDENGFISEELIRNKILEIKNEDIPKGRCAIEDTVIACRNLGAFVVAKTFNNGKYLLNLDRDTVCNDFFNNIISDFDDDFDSDYDDDDEFEDFDEDDDFEEEYECESDNDEPTSSKYYSKTDLIDTITVLLGGYVAEELILNKVYDNVSFYLSIVDSILESIAKNGMWGLEYRYSNFRNNDILHYSSEFIDKINQKFNETINKCYESAKNIVSKNIDVIKKLIPCLVEKVIIEQDYCEVLLESLGGIKS